MAEAFKHLLGPREVRAASRHLARAAGRVRAFDAAGFERAALQGLETLELKARAAHVADALQAHLPAQFDRAVALLERALAPPADPKGDVLPGASEEGLAGWIVWPLGEYVARRGLADPERALAALHAFTQRFTAEWAIRPYLEQHTALTLGTLWRWTKDPSAHVRRLVSEGTRPRLPWGRQLRAFIADPTPTLPLLRALQDDPAEYVRRSVANHLNDIAKDHPHVVVAWTLEHLPGADDSRRALLRHACRTLIKQGERRVLEAFGLGAAFEGRVTLACAPRRVRVGEAVTLEVTIESRARAPQPLAIDYVVHHVKANGASSPKVFKGWSRTIESGERLALAKRHSLRPVTTRRYYPGTHRVTLNVNGFGVSEGSFELILP